MNQTTLNHPPALAPDRLYGLLRDSVRGAKIFLALRSAMDRGLFAELDTPRSNGQLADALGVEQRLLAPLCGLLHQAGFLERHDDTWTLPDDVRFYLAQPGPFDQQAVVHNLAETLSLWGRLDEVLESGPLAPSREGGFGGSFLPALAAESLTGEAQRTAEILARVPGMDQACNLVDLGGGHGLYSLALCALLPLLRAEILDQEPARTPAETFIARFGDGRTRFTAANIFQDSLGENRDAVLLFYNPAGKRADMLERIHACLATGGIFASKHAFYSRGEGGKDPLNDLEWNLTAFPGVHKGPHVYRFRDDLDFEDYRALLEQHFEIVAEHGPEDFAAPDLGKFGDRLDSRLIVARKR